MDGIYDTQEMVMVGNEGREMVRWMDRWMTARIQGGRAEVEMDGCYIVAHSSMSLRNHVLCLLRQNPQLLTV